MANDPKSAPPQKSAQRGSTLLPTSVTVLAVVLINVAVASWLVTAVGAGPAGVPAQVVLVLALLGFGAAAAAVLLWRRWLHTRS